MPSETPPETPETPPSPPDPPAHIGHVLEQVRRQARLSVATLAYRTGVVPDHLAGILAGRRFPSRRFTSDCARVCGADPLVLLMVWEDEHDRRNAPVLPES
ncbi:helix-turn-helix domain-containing protein [Streptomyces sp. NPDC088789]|uniref:helix-turn-helix domain-containing protein n=1 Tax=Streptomyces sp. NPDC088789 TaxID=3365899 RepID=UPI00381F69E5